MLLNLDLRFAILNPSLLKNLKSKDPEIRIKWFKLICFIIMETNNKDITFADLIKLIRQATLETQKTSKKLQEARRYVEIN
jgi:hypothetical protein